MPITPDEARRNLPARMLPAPAVNDPPTPPPTDTAVEGDPILNSIIRPKSFQSLEGTEPQMRWGETIRLQRYKEMAEAGIADAEALAAKPFRASWFINRRETPLVDLVSLLRELQAARRTSEVSS